MRKLFNECGEDLDKYKLENDLVNMYYIADDMNFKEQVTIRDYYRILLVDNTGDITVEELNNKLEELKNKEGILDYIVSDDELCETINEVYNLNLEFKVSLYYDDFDYFKHGYIVYDNIKKCFDSADNWDEVVTTFIYHEEHGFIATMEIEVKNDNLESPYPEVHIDEIDIFEEIEVIEDDEINEDKENVVIENKVVESTSVKKLDDDKFLIIISSKLAGHIDMALIVTEKELVKYLKEENAKDIDKYLEKINVI